MKTLDEMLTSLTSLDPLDGKYKLVTMGLAIVAVPIFFWLVKRSCSGDPIPEIPLACPDKAHWFLGHAPMMQDMLNGLHKICVEESKVDGLSKFKLVSLTAISVMKADHVKAALTASNYRQRIPLIAKHMDMFLGRRALVQLMKD